MQPLIDQHHMSALHLYTRAIHGVKQRFEHGNTTPMLALLSCILFICIEVIRDNVFSALALFKKGNALLQSYSRPEQGTAGTNHLFTVIELMFSRLGVLAVMFGQLRPQEVSPAMKLSPRMTVSAECSEMVAMADARTELFAFIADGNAFTKDCELYNVPK